MNNVYGIIFNENGKIYNFYTDEFILEIGNKVIVETEKGCQYGKIVKVLKNTTDVSNMKKIIRKATEIDYEKYLENAKMAEDALIKAKKMVEEIQLDMNLLTASYTFDRSQLFFNFIADKRVDFRDLVKKMASTFHTRIELRQIGIRDKAKEISGIGPCGRKLCCSSFLNIIDPITINMAKNQGIALNPSKINGACGRLLCCLSYEDEEYQKVRNELPAVGSHVKTKDGNGIVVSINILMKQYTVKINDNFYDYTLTNEGKEK